MKSFNLDMANDVGTWLGATAVAPQDTLVTGAQNTDVMSGINVIQTTLADMQVTLEKIAGDTIIPTVTTTPVVEEKKTIPSPSIVE
jgi:hypothetical protein